MKYHRKLASPETGYLGSTDRSSNHYRPVVVERHYHQEPVYYPSPAPSGFFFGMSVAKAGSAFSFGVSGR
jgi:hypothetical protein